MTIQVIPLVVIPSFLLTFVYLAVLKYISKRLFRPHRHSPGSPLNQDDAMEQG